MQNQKLGNYRLLVKIKRNLISPYCGIWATGFEFNSSTGNFKFKDVNALKIMSIFGYPKGTTALLIIIIIYLINGSALASQYWAQGYSGPGGYWSIERQSSGTGITEFNSDIRGSITPVRVTPSGRSINGSASKYSSLLVNDVGSKEKLSALEGRIIIQDGTFFAYTDNDGGYTTTIGFPGGNYHAENQELWPVVLLSRNDVNYKGSEINDVGEVRNTYDRIGEKLLYNKNFEKDLLVNTSLTRFNATVDVVNNSILAEIQPTKWLNYNLNIKTTGIADLSAGIVDTKFDVRHRNYPYSMQNEERYVGNYNIQRKIQVNSTFNNFFDQDYNPGNNWLPCLCLDDGGFKYPEYIYSNPFEDRWRI